MMKKIDKKACRQHLEPLCPPASDCGLFLLPKLQYIIRTAVKTIGHRRLLVLCLYARGGTPGGRPVLAYTMFQATDNFITYDHRRGSKSPWRTAMLENLSQEYLFAQDHCAFYSRLDEQRVLDFCGDHTYGGAWALARYQQRIRDEETRRRVRRRQKAVVDEFKCLRPLPKGVHDWLRRDVLPAYFFYDYRKGAKRVHGVCSACEQDMELEGVRHNAKGVCPCCGRTFTMKSNKKRGLIWDRETASVVQRLRENELVVRILKASRWQPRGSSADLSFYEGTRVIVRLNGSKRADTFPYHNDPYRAVLTPWKKGYPSAVYLYGYNYNAETCGCLYRENLSRELRGTPWEYCQIGAFYQGIHEKMEVGPYLSMYPAAPAIEYFVKLKLFWLAAQIVYRGNYENETEIVDLNGRNLREILQIDPGDLCWLQRPTSSLRDLLLLRILRKEGHQPDDAFFTWLDTYKISETDCFECALQYTTPHKLMRYLDKQLAKTDLDSYPGVRGVLSDYRDYLGFCVELNYDMRNEFVLFPKCLKTAHDQAHGQIKCKEVEKYDSQIAAMRGKLKRQYQFKSKGLVVMPPHSAQEIMTEGHTLHHCVGSYAESMADNRCAILFIRQEKKQDKPFYTVEVRKNKIIQIRGRNNCAPTPEVKAFLDAWKKKKHLNEAA